MQTNDDFTNQFNELKEVMKELDICLRQKKINKTKFYWQHFAKHPSSFYISSKIDKIGIGRLYTFLVDVNPESAERIEEFIQYEIEETKKAIIKICKSL